MRWWSMDNSRYITSQSTEISFKSPQIQPAQKYKKEDFCPEAMSNSKKMKPLTTFKQAVPIEL